MKAAKKKKQIKQLVIWLGYNYLEMYEACKAIDHHAKHKALKYKKKKWNNTGV